MKPWELLWLLPIFTAAMRVDPERIAARLRLEAEYDDHKPFSRNRRQLQPKEVNIQVTAPLFSGRLFDYGRDAGDTEVPQALDVGKKVDLFEPMSMYGEKFSTVYILSNGGIAFESSSRSYKSGLIPGGAKMVAPFWNRNDLRNGGHVYYRRVNKGRVLDRGYSEIRYQYDVTVKVTSALVVTWENMQPLGSALPEQNTNTFQAVIFVTDNGTYANFIYSNIGWTQGAEAGFNKGDGSSFFALPTSGTANIMYLEEYGNTGIPGEWMFHLADQRLIRCKPGIKGDTCDVECQAGEWGFDCANCCRCARGACNSYSGDCPSGCGECWTGAGCQTKQETCRAKPQQCAANAISFTDYDRCGEPQQRCQCLSGFTGDGYRSCHDVDECRNKTICHELAICTNTPGRYFCQCKEGYSGDGITECTTSFLYPSAGHPPLPNSRNSKVTWQLKNPLKILGKKHDHLTITSSGLISINEVSGKLGEHLDDVGMQGIAPFFAPIDITSSGNVTVAEATDSTTLTRVSRTIREAYGDEGFQASSALIVTFSNVSDGRSHKGNTFQAVISGGFTRQRQPRTYVQLLYRDMPWGDGAEAGIMTNDLGSSLLLPGSGSQGLSQLTQLSNIHQPGIWLYRIDDAEVSACPKEDLLPPYCEVNVPATNARPKFVEATLAPKPKLGGGVSGGLIGSVRPILPSFPHESIDVTVTAPAPTTRPTTVKTTPRPRPTFKNTPHRPLVSFGADDFNVDDDVFEIEQKSVTFAPFITVIPEIVTPKRTQQMKSSTRKLPDFTVTEEATTSTVRTTAFLPSIEQEERVEIQHSNNAEFLPTREEIPSSQSTPSPSPVASTTIPTTMTTSKVVSITTKAPTTVLSSNDDEEFAEEILLPSSNDVFTDSAPIPSTSANQPLFVFTTTTKPRRPTTRPSPRRPSIVTAGTTTSSSEEEVGEGRFMGYESIIPICVVSVWIMVMIGILIFFCCRRSKTADLRLHGAQYGVVRPTSYALKRGSRHMDTYEDHLDKAARLSNESGRVSLYGSYWNLNNSSTPSPASRHSPPSGANYNMPRYTYTGRY